MTRARTGAHTTITWWVKAFKQIYPNADVDVQGVVVPTVFTDFDDYWTPFLGGTGPAPSYAMSLPEDRRTGLREALRSRLPTDDDGAIRLTARAWAIRGVRR